MNATDCVYDRRCYQHLNSWFQQKEWRRSQVLELSSKGYNQSEIAKILLVDRSTVCRDINFLREESKYKIRKYIDEILPEEYEKCLVGITSILKEAWIAAQQTFDSREKIQALSLAKECYSMKLELLTNATVVDDVLRFVSNWENQKSEKSKTNDPAINIDTFNDVQRSEKKNIHSRSPCTINKTF